MINKIKTLREIVEPKANKLGISFEEVVESLSNSNKVDILLDLLFNDKPNSTSIKHCFDIKGFKRVAKEDFYIKLDKSIIDLFKDRSRAHANLYNSNYTGRKHLFFPKIGKGTYLINDGVHLWLNKKEMLNYNIRMNNIRWETYNMLHEEKCEVFNYLLVIEDFEQVKDYCNIFSCHPDDILRIDQGVKNLRYSTMMRFFIERLIVGCGKFSEIKERWQFPVKDFVEESEFKWYYEFSRDFNSVKDIKKHVDECTLLFKKWSNCKDFKLAHVGDNSFSSLVTFNL